MSDIVIIDALRTPRGRGNAKGALAGVKPVDLLAAPLSALAERHDLCGRALADARAIHPDLVTMEAEPEEDARTLDHIAAWCERFTWVMTFRSRTIWALSRPSKKCTS